MPRPWMHHVTRLKRDVALNILSKVRLKPDTTYLRS